jgi:hypothetical protein
MVDIEPEQGGCKCAGHALSLKPPPFSTRLFGQAQKCSFVDQNSAERANKSKKVERFGRTERSKQLFASSKSKYCQQIAAFKQIDIKV